MKVLLYGFLASSFLCMAEEVAIEKNTDEQHVIFSDVPLSKLDCSFKQHSKIVAQQFVSITKYIDEALHGVSAMYEGNALPSLDELVQKESERSFTENEVKFLQAYKRYHHKQIVSAATKLKIFERFVNKVIDEWATRKSSKAFGEFGKEILFSQHDVCIKKLSAQEFKNNLQELQFLIFNISQNAPHAMKGFLKKSSLKDREWIKEFFEKQGQKRSFYFKKESLKKNA